MALRVDLVNPAWIVTGGDLSDAGERLPAGIRETIRQGATPLATERLSIVRTARGERPGPVGAAAAALEDVLSPDAVDSALNRR
ncbi:hypothetical protein ACGF3G_10430 [Streptomyces sp. NPDC048179]|uniref:hypothetical protein n=1 Tax=Streptomyces sp. NPDC048179 TaxID=3365506 RepID=UPI00371B0FE2